MVWFVVRDEPLFPFGKGSAYAAVSADAKTDGWGRRELQTLRGQKEIHS